MSMNVSCALCSTSVGTWIEGSNARTSTCSFIRISRAAVPGLAASPGTAARLMRMNEQVDVRALLPSIQVPTLVLHRAQDTFIDIRHSRYLAEHIPGARYVELPGSEAFSFGPETRQLLDEVEEFL